jgi:hypothetical protein
MEEAKRMENKPPDRLREQLYATAESAGLRIISDDKCCRLMAWLYTYGGNNEQVLDGKVSFAIFYAQRRLNLFGGETPNTDLLPVLQGYIKDITGGDQAGFFCNSKNDKYYNPPEWVVSLEEEFGIKSHRRKK